MRLRTLLAAGLVLAAAVAAAALALILWFVLAPRRTPPGQPPLAGLDASLLPSFRDDFNAHAGQVRVLALLSPT